MIEHLGRVQRSACGMDASASSVEWPHLGEGVFEQRFSDDRVCMIMRNRQT
jgi:hypothetical protein